MTIRYPDQTSPFIDGSVADRLIQLQLDLVKVGEKPAAQAMKDAAASVNAEIQKTLLEDPNLMAEYKRLTGRTGP